MLQRDVAKYSEMVTHWSSEVGLLKTPKTSILASGLLVIFGHFLVLLKGPLVFFWCFCGLAPNKQCEVLFFGWTENLLTSFGTW